MAYCQEKKSEASDVWIRLPYFVEITGGGEMPRI